MRRRPFFGWIIAVVAGLGLATGIATVVAATFSIFVGPMRDECGREASLPFWAPLAVTLALLFAPLIGIAAMAGGYGNVLWLLVALLALAAVLLAPFRPFPDWNAALRA